MIKLLLRRETRDSINAILTKFVSILRGFQTTDQSLKGLQMDNSNLIIELGKLERFDFDDGQPKNKITKKAAPETEHLELDYELSREIVDLLQQNADYSLKYFDALSCESKKGFISKNEKLMENLKKLKEVTSDEIVILPEKNCQALKCCIDNDKLLMIIFHFQPRCTRLISY